MTIRASRAIAPGWHASRHRSIKCTVTVILKRQSRTGGEQKTSRRAAESARPTCRSTRQKSVESGQKSYRRAVGFLFAEAQNRCRQRDGIRSANEQNLAA